MPIKTTAPLDPQNAMEHLRQGTRQQYLSDWTSIPVSASEEFTHELGEVPFTVDVIEADSSEGYNAITSSTATISKTDTTITVTVGAGGPFYYQVRAM